MSSEAKKEIDEMLSGGATPREIHRHFQLAHRKRVEAEIAAGKWRCPKCGEPLKMSEGAILLYCDRHDEKCTAPNAEKEAR